MRLLVIFAMFIGISSAQGAVDFTQKGSAKLGVGFSFSFSTATANTYSLSFDYKKFIFDGLALGGRTRISGRTGKVLSGVVLGVGADYYPLKKLVGPFFLGLDAGYSRASLEVLDAYLWQWTARAKLGYDIFVGSNLAVTPQYYWDVSLAESESDLYSLDGSDNGFGFEFTYFF